LTTATNNQDDDDDLVVDPDIDFVENIGRFDENPEVFDVNLLWCDEPHWDNGDDSSIRASSTDGELPQEQLQPDIRVAENDAALNVDPFPDDVLMTADASSASNVDHIAVFDDDWFLTNLEMWAVSKEGSCSANTFSKMMDVLFSNLADKPRFTEFRIKRSMQQACHMVGIKPGVPSMPEWMHFVCLEIQRATAMSIL
jgi:hypothetical protein